MTSKCRRVPLKSFTIPHLELSACVLWSKLLVSVLEALKREIKDTVMFCWSDSMVALWWIKEVYKRWGVWVQNRVEVIRGNTSPGIWFHVPSTSNPSDISTRSISLDHLDFVHWFHSPQFLLDHQENWPSKELVSSAETKLEERRADLAVNMVRTACHGIGEVLNCHDYSSFEKLFRVTSYILRFKANILSKLRKKPAIFTSAELTTTELEESKKLWLLYDQNVIISKENFSKVKNSLNLFYDENNFLRFKTRISSVETFSCDKKCPILLNKDTYVTKLIILNAHESVCHSGVTSMLNFICSKLWIGKGRQTVKKILKKCFICKYVNGKTLLGPATPCGCGFRRTNLLQS